MRAGMPAFRQFNYGTNYTFHNLCDLRRRSLVFLGRAWRGVGVFGGDGDHGGGS